MHKKNKNKNKNPKNTNPSPPQQLPADTFSEPEPAGDLEQVRVPEIPQVSEVNAEAGQTPAKPKRHRAGKKRKQNESKQENINVEEPITETTITKKTENLQESNKQEIKDFFSKQDSVSAPIFFAELPLIPAARKKKGKQSNLSENDDTIQPPLLKMKLETKKSTKEELTSEEEVPSENEQNTKYLNKSVEEPESKGEKKKNKKNKKSGDNFPNISEPAPEEACQASELYLCSDPTKESEINENRKAQEGNEIIFESKNNKHIISSKQTEDKIFSDCGKENKKNKKKKNSQSEEIKDCNKIGVIVEEKILEPVSEVSIDKYTDKIEMVDETRNKLNKSGKENKKTKSKEENKINENILEKHLKISATTESIELPTNFVLPAGPTPVVIEDDNNNFVNQGTRKPQKNQIKKIAKQVIEEDSNMHAQILQSSSVNTTDEENTILPDSDCKIESSCKNNKMSKPNVGDLMCHLADKNISMALKKETCENTIDIHEPKISVYSLIKPEEQYKTEECILSVLDKVKPDKVKKDLKTDVPIQCDTHLKTVNPENIINMSCTLFDKRKSGTNNNDDLTTTHPIKKESSDLKDKVMEVNRDMEELQMSIEKSLAELTAMETDEIPELVAITEYKSSPTDTNKQEDITSINVETHMQAPPRNMSAKVTSIDNSKEEGTESFTEIELTNLQTVLTNIPQDFTDKNTIPVKQEKNKGKGKGHKQPTKIINLETSHTTSTSKLPMLQQNVTLASVDFTIPKGVILPEVVLAPEVHETMIEPFSCSQEHTNKGKGKNKKHKLVQSLQLVATSNAQTQSASTESTKSECADKKSSGGTQEALNKKNDSDKEKSATNDTKPATDDEHIGTGKETEYISQESNIKKQSENVTTNFVSIETFEDAMTTSFNDVLKKKEVISINMKEPDSTSTSFVIPIDSQDMLFDSKDSIKNKADDDKNKAENPVVTHPKNLLGHPDIPVTSNKNDYKKEKNKNVQTPNAKHARIKVKDAVDIAKESQTKINLSDSTCKEKEELSAESDSEEEYVYKYSFRKVFLANACHVCKSELKGPSQRVACGYCNLVFYCGQRHKDEDWPQHQALCFAVSTIAHLKGLKFIYGEAAGADGQEYRLLRMQAIVSCEKILKRKLSPCEQEALLYPRLCSAPGCREWRAAALADCAGCGLVSYCKERPEHLQPSHGTWCGSYRLYHRLVTHQQNKGRLEPALPAGSVGERDWRLPADMGQLLGRLYRRPPPGPDLDEAHYAALTQLATAPLTAAYSYQLFHTTEQAARGLAHSDDMALAQAALTLHVVGAELQFEADALNKWEVFFLHVQPALAHLRVVFVGPELNPSNLPLHLLANIKMCRECRQKNRKVTFEYHDGQLYHDYAAGDKFTRPDIVCAFNPGLHRSSGFGGVDSWPDTINAVLALGAPFCVTSYTRYELPRDLQRVRECARHPYAVRLQPTRNPFASLRPDRNFISDDEMPLIFKNYYIMLLSGAAGAAGTSTSHLS